MDTSYAVFHERQEDALKARVQALGLSEQQQARVFIFDCFRSYYSFLQEDELKSKLKEISYLYEDFFGDDYILSQLKIYTRDPNAPGNAINELLHQRKEIMGAGRREDTKRREFTSTLLDREWIKWQEYDTLLDALDFNIKAEEKLEKEIASLDKNLAGKDLRYLPAKDWDTRRKEKKNQLKSVVKNVNNLNSALDDFPAETPSKIDWGKLAFILIMLFAPVTNVVNALFEPPHEISVFRPSEPREAVEYHYSENGQDTLVPYNAKLMFENKPSLQPVQKFYMIINGLTADEAKEIRQKINQQREAAEHENFFFEKRVTLRRMGPDESAGAREQSFGPFYEPSNFYIDSKKQDLVIPAEFKKKETAGIKWKLDTTEPPTKILTTTIMNNFILTLDEWQLEVLKDTKHEERAKLLEWINWQTAQSLMPLAGSLLKGERIKRLIIAKDLGWAWDRRRMYASVVAAVGVLQWFYYYLYIGTTASVVKNFEEQNWTVQAIILGGGALLVLTLGKAIVSGFGAKVGNTGGEILKRVVKRGKSPARAKLPSQSDIESALHAARGDVKAAAKMLSSFSL